MPTVTDVEGFLAACKSLVGPDRVCTGPLEEARYARTTGLRGCPPTVVLLPTSVEDVQNIVRQALQYNVPLHAISRGYNWGYGDALPFSAPCALLDLSRMNRILEINRDLGYAVVEPGVSQGQLYEAVQREAPEYWIDATGAGPEASIVGNILERGFGHTPYGDHVRTTACLEVVLADGNIVHTGFGHFPQAAAAHVYPYGVGPMLDGLFSQSNLGIVTKVTVWLYPKPACFRFFYVRVEAEEGLEPLIDTLRALRMQGVLSSTIHVANDLRILSATQTYPWTEARGQTPLPKHLREALRRQRGLGYWSASGGLYGTHAQVKAAQRAVRQALRKIGRVTFVDDALIAHAERVARILTRLGGGKRLTQLLDALIPNYGLLKGIPTSFPLRAVHWRKRQPPKNLCADPRDTGSGLVWISPVLPAQGVHARQVLQLMEEVLDRHGFDTMVTFTFLNERALVGVFNLSFDRDEPADRRAAEACYAEAVQRLSEKGYYPYRVAHGHILPFASPTDAYYACLKKIKDALDPQGILFPGRYDVPAKIE